MKPLLVACIAITFAGSLAAAEGGAITNRVKLGDGSVRQYTFALPAAPAEGTRISQQQAVLAGLLWAKNFYSDATGLGAAAAEYRPSPVPHYVVPLVGEIGGGKQQLYAVVLENGQLVRPSVESVAKRR
jgi:hypothetical protein